MSKLQIFYQNYSSEDQRHQRILARVNALEHVQGVLNHRSLLEEEQERFFNNLYSVLSHKIDTLDTFPYFYEHLDIQFRQLTQFTLQSLSDIIECQNDLFSFEPRLNDQAEFVYQDENGDLCFYEQASTTEQVDVKALKRFLIENLNNIENHIRALKLEEEVLSLNKKKLLTELSDEIMPNTELLLTIDDSLDEDLMAIKDYREHRNSINNCGFLWIELENFSRLIKFVGVEWSEIMSKITKLSILHHSGHRLLENEYDYSPLMTAIGDQLLYVSSVVLRGCGMGEEKRSKELAEKEQKKCANYNPTSDFKWVKRGKEETTRQHTLDIKDSASGMQATSRFAASTITALKESSFGAKVGNVSMKLYVGPYKGNAETGAEGLLGLHERYKRAPKALRFFIKEEEAKSGTPQQSDLNDDLEQCLLSNRV